MILKSIVLKNLVTVLKIEHSFVHDLTNCCHKKMYRKKYDHDICYILTFCLLIKSIFHSSLYHKFFVCELPICVFLHCLLSCGMYVSQWRFIAFSTSLNVIITKVQTKQFASKFLVISVSHNIRNNSFWRLHIGSMFFRCSTFEFYEFTFSNFSSQIDNVLQNLKNSITSISLLKIET